MTRGFLSPLRTLAAAITLVLMLSGCSLFNSAQQERQSQNQQSTSGVQLGRIVTAEGIGERNAPVGETDTFSASQDYIYVVAEADRIDAGTTMFARWSRDGEPFEDSSELRADRDYENTYVEFHLENLQSSMETGDYSVQILVNGNPAGQAQFTVR